MSKQDENQPLNQEFDPGQMVAFADRFFESGQFRALFREGMGLVESAANYLDGDGRSESKHLDRSASILYASESMRLTTRLMQIASWLLLQRAVSEGEMSQTQAVEEKSKVSLDTLMPANDDPSFEELPRGLLDLIEQSLGLQRRVRRWDMVLAQQQGLPSGGNAVLEQMSKLAEEFGAKKK